MDARAEETSADESWPYDGGALPAAMAAHVVSWEEVVDEEVAEVVVVAVVGGEDHQCSDCKMALRVSAWVNCAAGERAMVNMPYTVQCSLQRAHRYPKNRAVVQCVTAKDAKVTKCHEGV